MFAKIFTQIFDSSIAENWQVRHVFTDLLTLADVNGVVDMTREAIARRTNTPLEVVSAGIANLEEPDPQSRSTGHDGRRIVRLDEHRDWGWAIVNYQQYRQLATEEDRRAKTRERVRRLRERTGNPPHDSEDVTPCNAPVTPCNVESKPEKVNPPNPLEPYACNAGVRSVTLCTQCNAMEMEKKMEMEGEGSARARTRGQDVNLPHDPKPTPPPNGPEAQEGKGNGRPMHLDEADGLTNKPTLGMAIRHFAKASDYEEAEVKAAFLSFEASKSKDGAWWWGKRLVGDWRAAMESRMAETRARDDTRPGAKRVSKILQEIRNHAID